MFSYYTVYGVESETFPRKALRAASQVNGKAWVFFTDDEDDHPVCTLVFEKLGKRGGAIEGTTVQGDRLRLTPLTLEALKADLKENAALFGLSDAEVSAIQTEGDLYLFLIASHVPEWYVDLYGPPEEQASLEEEVSLALVALEEASGVPAKVGDIHRWSDGNEYRKQTDGSWRRVDTEWSDTHQEIPKSTKAKYYDENEGWDHQRKATHARLLKTVSENAFQGKKPVPASENPEFTYIMGPPAAGKTTRQSAREYDNTVKLDPDEFVERLPEFEKAQQLKVRNGAQAVVDEALMLNDKLIEDAKEGRYNFIVSGTGSNLNWMEQHLFPDLKRRGYRINVVMTYVDDLDELMLRTEARGHARGRFVPAERTQQLHAVLPKNFKELMKNPDVTSLALLNSHQTESQREAKNAFVYQQVGDQKSVLDKDFFESFMEKTK